MYMLKNRFSRILMSFGLCAAMAATTYAPVQAASVSENSKDGTYEGTGSGFEGDITLSVTLQDGKITAIDVVDQSEDDPYWSKATALFDTIIANNGTDGVDTVSGATYSSNGIIEAVEEALEAAVPGIKGSGTEDDPYVIRTAEDLETFAQNVDEGNTYAGEYVELGDDIDLSGIETWNPIGDEAGTSGKIFAGTFDGCGYTIDGMTIEGTIAPTAAATYGLFSTLDKTAVVENLNMANVSIDLINNGTDTKGQVRAGSIAGDSVNADKVDNEYTGVIGTRIDNCSAEGNISVVSNCAVMTWGGGMIGRAMICATITNCWTDVDCTTKTLSGSNSAYAGGIAGSTGNYVNIVNCAAYGDNYAVSSQSTNFGGMAGGIVGMLAGRMYNVVAAGNVTIGNGGTANNQWVGSIAGEITSSGMEKQTDGSYAYAATGAYRAFGYYATDSEVKEEVYTSGEVSSTNTVDPSQAMGYSTKLTTYDKVFETQGLTKEEMGADTFAETMSGNIKDTLALLKAYGLEGIELNEWTITDGRALPNGDTWVTGEIDASMFESGDGSEDAPYEIATAEQLADFAASMNKKIDYTDLYVALDADVDISTTEWTPIGGSDYAFNGTFDGCGHTVSGMTIGTEDQAKVLTSEEVYTGFFGVLGEHAKVSNLNLTDVGINTSSEATAYVGGIAGVMDSDASGRTGAVIDHCYVSGKISHTADAGNQFVGGLVAYQIKGAVINSQSDASVSGVVLAGDLAEVGGLVALNNRGLVANCLSDCEIYASGSREDGNEGMGVASNLVAVQAGDLVNCYASGDCTTKEYSTYVGMVSGWVTGIGKSYKCWYNLDNTMIIGEETTAKQVVNPVESIGTKVASGVNDEGDAYTGGLVDGMTGVKADALASAAEGLNGTFGTFAIDITQYGLEANALRTWKCEDGALALTDEYATVTYQQPECEKVPAAAKELKDGEWYGRDDAKKVVVKITVEDGAIVDTVQVSGEEDADAYDAALAVATDKAYYGDDTDYSEADPSKFAGGSGTKEDPYQIANVSQLQYLADSINEDVDWEGVYFKQTADIDLAGVNWRSIGWALNAEVKGAKKLVAAYPFKGSYDGDDYKIKNLTVGSEESPADQMTSGLFGMVSGSYTNNDVPTGEETVSYLSNIHLTDVDINVSTRYETYAGTLLGNGQNGVYIDNCSATGKLNTTTSESFNRAGGLVGNILRGAVTNSWADVDVNAETGSSHVYAGGLFSLTNRATVINCYALGDVTGNSENNNKVHIGGLTGQQGGVQMNCYAVGNVISLKTTTDVGGLNGRDGGIAVDYNCYYNSEAVQKNGDTTNETAVAVGVNANDSALVKAEGMTAEAMKSETYAQTLNANRDSVSALLAADGEVGTFLAGLSESGFTHLSYYQGNALADWIVRTDGAVGFADPSKDRGQDVQPVQTTLNAPTIAVKRTSGKAKISWKAVEGATSYIIYASKNGKTYSKLATTTKTSYTHKKAAAGTKYYYKVKAAGKANGAKIYSKYSKAKSFVTTLSTPKLSVKLSKGKPVLSWKKVKGATKYVIYKSSNGKKYKKLATTKKLKYTDKKLKAGKTGYYKVKAVTSKSSAAGSKYSKVCKKKATK